MIRVAETVAEILENLRDALASPEPAGEDQFIDQVGGADGDLGEELGAIEEQEPQLKQLRVARPGFERDRARPVGRNETVEPREHPIGVGERPLLFLQSGGGGSGRPFGRGAGADRQQPGDELQRELGGPLADVDIAWAVGEFVQQPKRLVRILEAMLDQDFPPFSLGAAELLWVGRVRLSRFGVDELLVDRAHAAGVPLQRGVEPGQAGAAHQPGQPTARLQAGRDGVGLEIVLHLHPMLDLPQETVGALQILRFASGEQFILSQLPEGRQGLGALQERDASGLEQLRGLGHKFDLADSTAAELHIAVELAGPNDLRLEAGFHRRDLAQRPLAQRARVTEGLDHFQEFRGERSVSRHAAGLDQHHALPGLAPLRVEIFVPGETAHERAGVPFRAEPDVNPVEHALGGGPGDLGDEGFRQALEELMIA